MSKASKDQLQNEENNLKPLHQLDFSTKRSFCWLGRGGRAGRGLTNPKGLPLYRRAKISKPDRPEDLLALVFVVSVGVTNFS